MSTPPPFLGLIKYKLILQCAGNNSLGVKNLLISHDCYALPVCTIFPRWLAFLYCCSKLPSGEGEVVSRWPQIPSMGETTPKLALNSFVKKYLLYTFHEKA